MYKMKNTTKKIIAILVTLALFTLLFTSCAASVPANVAGDITGSSQTAAGGLSVGFSPLLLLIGSFLLGFLAGSFTIAVIAIIVIVVIVVSMKRKNKKQISPVTEFYTN